ECQTKLALPLPSGGDLRLWHRSPDRATTSVPGSIHLTGSKLAEAAVEFAVVPAVHVAVPVEIEVPKISGVTDIRLERGPEEVTVQLVPIAVAVTVAEQPVETVHPVAAGRAIAVAVQLPPQSVVDPIRLERQGVAAVRQRPTDDVRSGEREHGDSPAADHGRGHQHVDRA